MTTITWFYCLVWGHPLTTQVYGKIILFPFSSPCITHFYFFSGRLGQTKAAKILSTIISNVQYNEMVRSLAVYSLQRVAKLEPARVKPILMTIIENIAERPEVKTKKNNPSKYWIIFEKKIKFFLKNSRSGLPPLLSFPMLNPALWN